MKTTVILLTSCVNPNGMSKTALQDVGMRKQQYIEALRFYLQNTDLPIVFVENSGADFRDEFESFIDKGRLEYITFWGNDYDKKFGKGYGEAIIIRYALDNSEILKKADIVIKITGRLKIDNIGKIIRHRFFLSSKVCRFDFWKRRFPNSAVVLMSYCTLKQFAENEARKIDDFTGCYFEKALYDSLLRQKTFVLPFFNPVKISGISGSHNTSYNVRSDRVNIYVNFDAVNCYYAERGILMSKMLVVFLNMVNNFFGLNEGN